MSSSLPKVKDQIYLLMLLTKLKSIMYLAVG